MLFVTYIISIYEHPQVCIWKCNKIFKNLKSLPAMLLPSVSGPTTSLTRIKRLLVMNEWKIPDKIAQVQHLH